MLHPKIQDALGAMFPIEDGEDERNHWAAILGGKKNGSFF